MVLGLKKLIAHIRKTMRLRLVLNKTLSISSDILLFCMLIPIAIIARIIRKKTRILKFSKVFLGLNECTGNIGRIQRALRFNGVAVTSLATKYPMYNQFDYDFTIDATRFHIPVVFDSYLMSRIPLWNFFLSAIHKFKWLVSIFWYYDYVIFNTSVSFLAGFGDYILFKISNIKLIVFHCGDDVRYRPISNKIWNLEQSVRISVLPPLPNSGLSFFVRRLLSQKMAEIFSEVLFTTFEQATFLSKPAFQFSMPVGSCKDYSSTISDLGSAPVRVLHAPSDALVKRTDIVIKAIELLRLERNDFEFRLLENVSNIHVISELRTCDIVIDQPNLLYGLLLREAMANACVVVGIPSFKFQEHLADTPIVPFESDPVLLKNVLAGLIGDREKLLKLKKKSHVFFKERFSDEAFFQYFENCLYGKIKAQVFPMHDHKKFCIKNASCLKQSIILKTVL